MLKDLINQIIELELEMFSMVRSKERAACQNNPDGFRLFRTAQFSPWSKDTLQSYLTDLQEANQKDINLMTIKYARMDDLIPKIHESPEINKLIDEIVEIQLQWQNEMKLNYPALMSGSRQLEDDDVDNGSTSFKTYLRCELETYSAVTLTCLYNDIIKHRMNNKNMTEAVYEYMVKNMNYNSLAEAEETISHPA